MVALKQIGILGATGQQGGAVAAALEKKSDGNIQVVAITRNPESPTAKELASRPNTIVRRADLNDVDSLVAAFDGCDGAFVVANFWEVMDAGKEMVQYKNATDALKKVGTMKHVIFSTLEETAKTGDIVKDFKILEEHETGGMTVPHFDGKARAEAYFDGLPTTFMVTSCYTENFGSFFAFVKQEDGSYAFTLPLGDKPIPWTIIPDLGTLCACAFGKDELIGKRIGQNSYFATGRDLATIFSKATGKTIKYNCVPWETFASFGFPGADELAQMFEFWLRTHDDFCKARDLDAQLKIMDGATFTDPIEYARTIPLKFDEGK